MFSKVCVAALALLGWECAAAVSEIKCDFTRGIPSDWILIDRDGNALSQDVARFGFSQGDAWVAYRMEEEDNAVACSTSWYAVPGTSSDWMILPDLEVDGHSELSWRSMAGDRRFPDGFAVYVGPAGASVPEDFNTSEPLFSTDAEEGSWTAHSVGLSQFAGQTVRIAFVNTSTDCQCLYVDDIVAGTPSPLSFESSMPCFTVLGRQLQVDGFILTNAPETLQGVTLTLSVDDETYTADFPELSLEPGRRVPVSWTTGFVPDRKADYAYELTVSSGERECSVEGVVRGVSHKVVVEEGTGTWCSWCVRGIVAMDEMRSRYPDNFIGIAIHTNDVMALDDYTPQDVLGTSGVPKAKINRADPCDPSQAEGHLVRNLAEAPKAALDLTVAYDEDTRLVETETEVSFAEFFTDKDYRLAYVVVENDVHHPGEKGYNQGNMYSGGAEGPMGGFEDKPNPVPSEDMWYQEVARGLMSPLGGVAGVIPHSMKAMERVDHSWSFTLPECVDDMEKADVIVMLIDNESGRIINAECAPVAGGVSVGVIDADAVRILPVDGGVRIEGADVTESCLYALDGRLLSRGTDMLRFDATGIGVVRVVTPSGIIVRKILLGS